jgi:uncharacterized protein YqfB (UPF0267 family)
MDKKEQLIYIAQNTGNYLDIQGRTLEKRLEEINLTESFEEQIVQDRALKTVRDKGLSLFGKLGDVVSTVINWNEQVNQDIADAKKMLLLEDFFNKVDDQAIAMEKLKELLTNPQGNTIFNKIIRILDDSPPDEELMKYLSKALKSITLGGNFEALFDQHKYALAQIERLTPQALTIISDNQQWPLIRIGTSMSFGAKITTDFYTEFTIAYCDLKGIVDEQKRIRIKHSVRELERQELMEAYRNKDNRANCQLTQVGLDLLPYIS